MPNMRATQGLLSVYGVAIGQLLPQRLQRGIFVVLLVLAGIPTVAKAAGEPIQFAPPITYIFGNPISRICAADFNGDRIQDLAVGGGSTQIWTNDGTGTLRIFTAVGSIPLAAADLNNDNRMDLLTVNSDLTPAVWLNNGNTFIRTNLIGAMSYPWGAAVGDLNGDGKPDLILQGDYYLQTFLGQADGAFTRVTNYSFGYRSVAVGKFNRDSRLDLVIANYPTSRASVLFGNGDGTFGSRTNYGFGSLSSGDSVAVGDFDGNGTLDFITANGSDGSVSVFLNNGDGIFSPENKFNALPAAAVAVADFNGDGVLDILLAGSRLAILPGLGNGTFGTAVTNFSSLVSPQYIAVADFDGDGRPDIAASGLYSVYVLLNRTLPPVRLSIQDASGLLVLNWSDQPGYKLEFSRNLGLPNSWSAVTNPSFVVGGQRIVVTTAEGDARTFRLRK
jgi:hypothetical protein